MFNNDCINYSDKILITGALIREKDRLKAVIKNLDIQEDIDTINIFKNEIIPEYEDLISRINNIPNCKME